VYQMLHPVLAREKALRAAGGPVREVSIRAAEAVDVAAVELAEQAPLGGVLVAESGGRVIAALAIGDGLAVADPFVRTASIVRLLRARAAQLARERRPRRLRVLRPA
jgi:hypothetical protein